MQKHLDVKLPTTYILFDSRKLQFVGHCFRNTSQHKPTVSSLGLGFQAQHHHTTQIEQGKLGLKHSKCAAAVRRRLNSIREVRSMCFVS